MGHATPHAPQWSGSCSVSTHALAHNAMATPSCAGSQTKTYPRSFVMLCPVHASRSRHSFSQWSALVHTSERSSQPPQLKPPHCFPSQTLAKNAAHPPAKPSESKPKTMGSCTSPRVGKTPKRTSRVPERDAEQYLSRWVASA